MDCLYAIQRAAVEAGGARGRRPLRHCNGCNHKAFHLCVFVETGGARGRSPLRYCSGCSQRASHFWVFGHPQQIWAAKSCPLTLHKPRCIDLPQRILVYNRYLTCAQRVDHFRVFGAPQQICAVHSSLLSIQSKIDCGVEKVARARATFLFGFSI